MSVGTLQLPLPLTSIQGIQVPPRHPVQLLAVLASDQIKRYLTFHLGEERRGRDVHLVGEIAPLTLVG